MLHTSQMAYVAFLLGIAALRLIELRVSERNQARLTKHGAEPIAEPRYALMVALHAGILVASAAEVILSQRPFLPALAIATTVVLAATNGVRWWVIRTLAGRWSVRVLTPSRLGIVTDGPYRYVRHPNYAAVFVEMIAIPLLHTAWLTALIGAVAHIFVLRARIALEESVLLANSDYRAAMAAKPRFIPRPF
ncbi:MAG: isoprenylcysteine carboxyl methyltransferase family protein [Candidatus Acidiferrales bacterium]